LPYGIVPPAEPHLPGSIDNLVAAAYRAGQIDGEAHALSISRQPVQVLPRAPSHIEHLPAPMMISSLVIETRNGEPPFARRYPQHNLGVGYVRILRGVRWPRTIWPF